MLTGSLTLYDNALNGLVAGSFPSLQASPICAILLAPAYVPDAAVHARFADVSVHEAKSAGNLRLQLTGASVAAAAFHSNDLIFGDPVTLGPVRTLALVMGLAGGLTADSPLLGYIDLAPAGGALEAQRGRFAVAAPASGWFQLARV